MNPADLRTWRRKHDNLRRHRNEQPDDDVRHRLNQRHHPRLEHAASRRHRAADRGLDLARGYPPAAGAGGDAANDEIVLR